MKRKKAILVATGCMLNSRGEVLVCQRPRHKIYPGEWEFPGGKVERGETVPEALARELHEELGIGVTASRPLIRIRHVYPELTVDLDTWLVTAWEGKPVSREHPASAWVAPGELPRWKLLAADRPIVNALRLPAHYVFTPPVPGPLDARSLPPCLLRVRLPEASVHEYAGIVRKLGKTKLMVDRGPARGAAGFHATSAALRKLRRRPVPARQWFAASCHGAAELRRARELGADFVVLGPVKPTATHARAKPLGWKGFEKLARAAGMPVYAIGGLKRGDLEAAWAHGAQGIAGISAYWGKGSG